MDGSHYRSLAQALADVADPRGRGGVRYRWGLLLTLIAAAMAAGQKHGRAIAQWVCEHTQVLAEELMPPGGRLPSESTLRRALSAVDTAELEARLSAYLRELEKRPAAAGGEVVQPSPSGLSLDGKAVRGAGAHGRKLHLLCAATHGEGTVLAQVEVGDKTNEIGAAPALLRGLDLRGTVVTADAMLAQRELARQILSQGGDYLMAVKENQPRTYEAIAELFEVRYWMRSEIGTRYWKHRTCGNGPGTRRRWVWDRDAHAGEQHHTRGLAGLAGGRAGAEEDVQAGEGRDG